VKFYETKQYKKGVKAADSILKKHPEHGETLCMKGLTLSYLDDKKEEAYDLVRKGLKYDLKSHVCWHVFGLLYRQDRDYVEAVKCYRNALRIDPENIQILRDLSLLQIHRRDLVGFSETRRKLLQVKSSNRLNWIGYAVAEHLCKNYEVAVECLNNYEKTFKDESATDFDISELYMYKASILEEAGKFEEALQCLKSHEKEIVDKLGLIEAQGRLNMFLEKFEESGVLYLKLLNINPEHHVYILSYMATQVQFHRFWPPLPPPKMAGEGGAVRTDLPSTIVSFPSSLHADGMPIWGWLAPAHAIKTDRRYPLGRRLHKRRLDTYQPMHEPTDEEQDALSQFFEKLQEEHPRSDSLKRLELYFLTGQRFQQKLDKYLRPCIRKGIPSLFRCIRPMYFQTGKEKLVEGLIERYLKNLDNSECSWFGPAVGDNAQESATCDPSDQENPTSLLFTWMLAAQHFNLLGETAKAFEFIDKAIEHTPTLVELYGVKARIYKHAGNLEKSAELFDEARRMDLADRYLNTQAVRALLRKDDVETGNTTVLLFSKEPDSPEAASNLHDMQCMWYESAIGRSYTRQEKWGLALKKFNETFKHFNDIAEDQFDFHNYCLRKSTLKTYVSMLRMQEKLFSHKFYRRAAKDAIRIHLELYDQKVRQAKDGSAEKDGEAKETELSAAERKKLKHKQKREAKKDQVDEKQAAAATGKGKKVDDDPNGDKLLEKDPLEEASKLSKNLVTYSHLDFDTYVMAYECYSRQEKWLVCVQALSRLCRLCGSNVIQYKVINPLTHFCFIANLENPDIPDAVRSVIFSEMVPVLSGNFEDADRKPFSDLKEMRAACTKIVDDVEKRLKATSDLPLIEVLAGLKCLKNAGKSREAFLEKWEPTGAFSLKESKKMLKYLSDEFGADSNITKRFKSVLTKYFPDMKEVQEE